MAFDVYPNIPGNLLEKPLNVAGSGVSNLMPITQRIGPDNVDEGVILKTDHPTTMFIRVAMLGAVPAPAQQPTIIIKANGGPETEIIDSAPNVTGIDDGSQTVALGRKHLPDGNNAYLIKVLVLVTSGVTWQMRIKNNDAVARDFTWVIADSLDEIDGSGNHVGSRQPWIDGGATLNFDALTSQSPAPRLTVTVANKGTGPLNIKNTIGSNAGSPDFQVGEVPAPIDPNHSGDLKIDFIAPATVGQSNATFDISTDDTTAQTATGHNKRVALQGVAHQLEIVLLVDASGSMGYTPTGGDPVADSDARWGKLKSSADQFLNVLGDFGEGHGSFGVAVFPDFTAPTYPPAISPSSGDIFTTQAITGANIATAIQNLSAPPPTHTARKAEKDSGATPIGHGIGHTIGTAPASYGYFSASADALNFNKRYLVLMTDGANNSGPPNPPDFYGSGPTSFRGKKVKVITVGYGDDGPNKFEVDHILLQTIATESDGLYLDAGVNDIESDPLTGTLKKSFHNAIIEGLNLEPTMDPSGLLTVNQPEARHQVTITPYDTKAVFIVNWQTFDADRVDVKLLTPTCELITPASAQNDPNITYHSHPTYAIYSFNHDYLRNAADPANPRYGAWRLVITGNFPPIIEIRDTASSDIFVDSEPYDFQVTTQSRLKLTLTTDRASYFAGDTINLTAALTLDGKGVPNASVVARFNAPGQSSDNFLAGNLVTAAEFSQAKAQLAKADVTALGIKAFALNQKGVFFKDTPHRNEVKMTDDDRDGHYTASFTNTSTPGTFSFYVIAIGQTPDGITFRREKRLAVRIDVRPEPTFTLVDTFYRTLIDGEVTIQLADVRVTPRDRFGNVVLIDPDFDSRLAPIIKNGKATAGLIWNLDASYTQTVQFKPGVTPSVGFSLDDQVIVPASPLAPVDKLHYVDRVTAFKLGGEAEKGANKHTDPNAALGDIRSKQPDQFVSLGAFGSLAVEIKRHVIEAQGDDDVTVFVRPDDTLRSYLVEALPAGKPAGKPPHGRKKTWVALGTSPGVTQSFSLSSAGIKKAAAIRITDKSGRTRDASLKPSSSPGVSILGVGAKKIGRGGHHKKPHDDKKYDDKKKGGDRDYSHPKPGGEHKGGPPKGGKPGGLPGGKPGGKPDAKAGPKQKTPKGTKPRGKK
jgi:hypothetical protein